MVRKTHPTLIYRLWLPTLRRKLVAQVFNLCGAAKACGSFLLGFESKSSKSLVAQVS
jgi:hypothetical protein